MNKQHILDEIKQTAEANGGAQDTGIKVTDQYSKYRAQWGDACNKLDSSPIRCKQPMLTTT